jgi:hypothetical protein
MENESDQYQRRPVGRPPKVRPKTSDFERKGIVKAPLDQGNALELIYDNPQFFKKIISSLKAYSVSEVSLDFTPERILLITSDYSGKSYIHTSINGAMMVTYYCEGPVSVCVKREDLENILNQIDKNHLSIAFYVTKAQMKVLHVSLKDIEMDLLLDCNIQMIERRAPLANFDFSEADYPLRFTLPMKYLKKMVNDLSGKSEILMIKKNPNVPLEFTYESINGEAERVIPHGAYRNNEKLNLRSTLAQDDIFAVGVRISHIKPITAANMADYVDISVARNRHICFTLYVDRGKIKKDDNIIDAPVCVIKVFTETHRME